MSNERNSSEPAVAVVAGVDLRKELVVEIVGGSCGCCNTALGHFRTSHHIWCCEPSES